MRLTLKLKTGDFGDLAPSCAGGDREPDLPAAGDLEQGLPAAGVLLPPLSPGFADLALADLTPARLIGLSLPPFGRSVVFVA